MKKIKSIALSTIAVALFGSAAMANAADLTANTSVTTTVQERSGFTASYNEIRSIKET
ncbi:fimbrial protein, partial [Escherichia coli]|nr:fimbrial protein [Escherichia coli]